MSGKKDKVESPGILGAMLPSGDVGKNPKVNTYSRMTFMFYSALFLYFAFTTEKREPNQNLYNILLISFTFLTMIGLSERKKQPYETWLPSIMKGFTVTYAIFLIAICQQNYPQAKFTWNILEPAVSLENSKKSFSTWQTNCDLSWVNFNNKLDRYSASHFFGWIFHALLIRDYWTMHFWSILTELVELLFSEVIPLFAECWWDQFICDMIVTNIPGMIIGMMIIRYMGWQEFDWLGRKDKKSFKEWEIWTNHKKILALFLLLLGYCIQFLGCFFVPNAFHTSPISNFSALRLVVWFGLGFASFKELYNYSCEKIDQPTDVGGHFSQIGMAVMLSEVTIILKHYEDSFVQFRGTFTLFQKIVWPATLTFYFIWYLYARSLIGKKQSQKQIKKE